MTKPKPCPICGMPAAYVSEDVSYCSYGHEVERLGEPAAAPPEKRRFGQTDDAHVSEVHAADLDAKQRAVYERWINNPSNPR